MEVVAVDDAVDDRLDERIGAADAPFEGSSSEDAAAVRLTADADEIDEILDKRLVAEGIFTLLSK